MLSRNYSHREVHEALKGNSELATRVIGAAIDVHKVPGPLINFNVSLLKQGIKSFAL